MDESILMDSLISEYDDDGENPNDPDWRQTPAHKLNRQSKVKIELQTDFKKVKNKINLMNSYC